MSTLRRFLAAPVLLAVAVVLQVTLVNRLPLPGGAAPNLTLLVVLALATDGGPVLGMLAGFLGGLALDVAPPGSELTGENALVFCLAGYGCGALAARLRNEEQGQRSQLATLPLVAAGAVAAEALLAGLGRMVSDPSITVPAIKHVLPAAIVYDAALSPIAVLLVAVIRGTPEPGNRAIAVPSQSALARRPPVGVNGTMPGATPWLSFASAKPAPPRRPPARGGLRGPEPRLRLASGSPPPLAKTTPSAQPHVKFGGSGRDGAIGGSVIGKAAASRFLSVRSPHIDFSGALGPSLYGRTGPRRAGGGYLAGTGPGKNWLRAGPRSLASRRSLSALGGAPSLRPPVKGQKVPGKGWLGPDVTASPVRSVKKSPGKGWLRGSGPTAPKPRAAGPGKGWLRVSGPTAPKPRVAGPGKGWLRPAKPVAPARRKSPGRGWLSNKPARLPLQRVSPRRGWLRQGWRPRRASGAGLGRGLGSGHPPGKVRIGGRR
jgi:rod shape-determining protein MreD